MLVLVIFTDQYPIDRDKRDEVKKKKNKEKKYDLMCQPSKRRRRNK